MHDIIVLRQLIAINTECIVWTFTQLEHRYGSVIAQALLCELERCAQLNSYEQASLDPEQRMQVALGRLSRTNAS